LAQALPERPPETPEDPIDLIARSVPRHIWLSLAVVAATLVAGLVFFDPAPRVEQPGDALPAGASVTLEGRVVAVLGEQPASGPTGEGVLQTVRVAITRGSQAGQEVEIIHGEGEAVGRESLLAVGDRVLIEFTTGADGDRYYVSDLIRWPILVPLALLFGVAVVAVGGMVGLRALISMGFSVLIIGVFIIPGILAGHDPLLIALVGSLALLTATLYLTYGWRPKTHAALLGLVVSLAITAVLASLFVSWTRLTGLGGESALFLRFGGGYNLDMRGVLLAGILIGTLGVLDDVTTNQASVTFELKRSAPGLSWAELFRRSMVVGRDHIAAVVNTLLLAYAGSSLTLLLLMASESASLAQTLNRSFMAEEIVRTLVGSLGLVLATPITSLIAGWLARRETAVTGEES
jgi:uncharacterized membrane protein